MPTNDLIAGLDIGTTKICCAVAELSDSQELILSGVGVSPSAGIKRGVVVDIEAAVKAVEDAVAKAARQSGREIEAVYVGVTGEHISSLNSKGVTAITHANREINEHDVARVKEQSLVIVVPPDRIILHAIPRAYSIDGQNGIRHPVGMSGSRLEVETHVVTAAKAFIENVEKCVARAGLGIADMVLEPLATAEAVVLPVEKSLGVCLLDIGGGTTDMAIFQGGAIYYSAVIPVGGSHVTNDIAQLLRVSTKEAERLKIESGCAVMAGVGDDQTVRVIQIGQTEQRLLRRRALCEIIEARMQELFQLVQKEIVKSGCRNQMPAGLILSGGGSKLDGTQDCAAQVLEMPVRVGIPSGISGLADMVSGPAFATAVGLLKYGAQQHVEGRRPPAAGNPISGITKSISEFFSRLRTN